MSGLVPGVDAEELRAESNALVEHLVEPPRPASDICPLCHSWREDSERLCNSCEVTGEAVKFPLGPPSVITLYSKPSPLRDWLTRYKGRPGDAEDPFDQTSYSNVRAILGRFLLEHGATLSDRLGQIDALVAVPSGGGRPTPHPMESVLTSLSLPVPVAPLLVRGPGELHFRRASTDGFVLDEVQAPRRVLLVEDVFVTGARVFSAARALLDGGHNVVGSLVIARRVNREWGGCQAMWDRQVQHPFDWQMSPRTVIPDDV